jgi:hypothetical protein
LGFLFYHPPYYAIGNWKTLPVTMSKSFVLGVKSFSFLAQYLPTLSHVFQLSMIFVMDSFHFESFPSSISGISILPNTIWTLDSGSHMQRHVRGSTENKWYDVHEEGEERDSSESHLSEDNSNGDRCDTDQLVENMAAAYSHIM